LKLLCVVCMAIMPYDLFHFMLVFMGAASYWLLVKMPMHLRKSSMMSVRKPSCGGGKVGLQVGEFRDGAVVLTSPDRVMPLESKLKVHPPVDLEKKPSLLQCQKSSHVDKKVGPQVRELRDGALVPTSPDCVTPPGSKPKVHPPVDLAKKPSPLQPQKSPRGGGKVGKQVREFRDGGPVPTSPDRVMPLETKLKVHLPVDLEKKPSPLQRQKPSHGDEKAGPHVRELRDGALVATSPDCETLTESKLKVHPAVDLEKKPQVREFRDRALVPTSQDLVTLLESKLKVHPPVDLEKKPSPFQCQKPSCGGGKVWPKVWEFRDGALVPTSPDRVMLLEGKPKVHPPMDLEGNPSLLQRQKASCGGSKVGPLVSELRDGSLVPTSPDRVTLLESKLKVYQPLDLEKKPSPLQPQKPARGGGKVGPQVWELRDGALVPTSPDRVMLQESKLKVHQPVDLEKKPIPLQCQQPSCGGGKVGPQICEFRDTALVSTNPEPHSHAQPLARVTTLPPSKLKEFATRDDTCWGWLRTGKCKRGPTCPWMHPPLVSTWVTIDPPWIHAPGPDQRRSPSM